MVELRTVIPGIVYDLRYATRNNFMHRRMYPKNTNSTFLRLPAALALQKIQYELNAKGYGLKIFDGKNTDSGPTIRSGGITTGPMTGNTRCWIFLSGNWDPNNPTVFLRQ
nr:M15 family metallopeptidase [Pseudoflavitalea rhizosphaerae]